MPYRKEEFANKEIYHIILRALDNNLIFKDENDYYRGIFSIYEFNNTSPVQIWKRRRDRIIEKNKKKSGEDGPRPDLRDLMVNVLAFCFMPNHIHLLLRQLSDNGITKFMSKVGTGYAGYFNRKYQRKGHVFQNRFSSVHIKDNNQLIIVFNYININPTSLLEPNFKEIGIKNPKKVVRFIEEYKWSSYQDYVGIKNFPSVTQREFMNEIIGGEEECKELLKDWIMYKKERTKSNNLFLE